MGCSSVARKWSPTWFLSESTGSSMRTESAVPAGISTGGGGGGGAGVLAVMLPPYPPMLAPADMLLLLAEVVLSLYVFVVLRAVDGLRRVDVVWRCSCTGGWF